MIAGEARVCSLKSRVTGGLPRHSDRGVVKGDGMTTPTKLNLSRQQRKEVDRLCAEFDPEKHIPEWIRDRGASEDWAAYARVDRYELRGLLEAAVLLGKALRQLDTAVRLEVFYAASDELTNGRCADEEDCEVRRLMRTSRLTRTSS
jgi:hypothetical protein